MVTADQKQIRTTQIPRDLISGKPPKMKENVLMRAMLVLRFDEFFRGGGLIGLLRRAVGETAENHTMNTFPLVPVQHRPEHDSPGGGSHRCWWFAFQNNDIVDSNCFIQSLRLILFCMIEFPAAFLGTE